MRSYFLGFKIINFYYWCVNYEYPVNGCKYSKVIDITMVINLLYFCNKYCYNIININIPSLS